MAKVIMVQGTMSNVGKSFVVAGLLRVFKQDGYRVAPFKSQNMALNSYITKDGLEMGRAQAMQAEAAGIEPDVCMNPILLKPVHDCGSQVIVNGKVISNMSAKEYFQYKSRLVPDILAAFQKLSESADIIVIEGAGSPAEINLKSDDIVNMGVAALVDAPVLLVGDIDRGGVFAQLLGTLMLLEEAEKRRVGGLVINKFRGDKSILDPGIKMLEEKSRLPVVGVLPCLKISLDDEDSLGDHLKSQEMGVINIAVVRLPRMSNYTDFHVFEKLPGVSVHYTDSVRLLELADMIIIPGSKNTIGDLKWMRECGIEAAIQKRADSCLIFGICGGFQMLGQFVSDPDFVEEGGSIRGMELLPVHTVLQEEKTTKQVSGVLPQLGGILSGLGGLAYAGYEIHAGKSVMETDVETGVKTGVESVMETDVEIDVICENNRGNVYGSYVHGIFDEGQIAMKVVEAVAKYRGISYDLSGEIDFQAYKESQYDLLAAAIREHMDMEAVYRMLNDAMPVT